MLPRCPVHLHTAKGISRSPCADKQLGLQEDPHLPRLLHGAGNDLPIVTDPPERVHGQPIAPIRPRVTCEEGFANSVVINERNHTCVEVRQGLERLVYTFGIHVALHIAKSRAITQSDNVEGGRSTLLLWTSHPISGDIMPQWILLRHYTNHERIGLDVVNPGEIDMVFHRKDLIPS